jgi:2-keto-4-pentenoate hydratase/2-oxohepta-3-ene-1,7-dioic acid hydratase in catechol pathway
MSEHTFLAKLPPAPKPDNINPATGLVGGSFGIGTYRAEGRSFPGLVQPDGALHDLSPLYPDTHAIFNDWERAFDQLFDIAAKGEGAATRLEEVEALTPLSHPQVLGAGSNYRQHVAEMMTFQKFNQHNRLEGESDEEMFHRMLAEVDRRKTEGMPFIWTGLHGSLCGANDDIQIPLIGEQMEWELELGVVAARGGRYIRPEEADQLIAGYVMINDLGTVDEFRRVDVRFQYDWIGKSQPGAWPLGPFIVPKQFVDRDKIQIVMKVNGKVMQDWPVTDMLFSPEELLSYASERINLLPGDLLFTGSPPGNAGSHGGAYLKPGDVVESELTYLGRQRNVVRNEEAHGRTPTYGPFITSW